jgi:tellurite resistance protein
LDKGIFGCGILCARKPSGQNNVATLRLTATQPQGSAFRVAFCKSGGQTTPMTSFFEHQRTSYKRNYLRNLIALACSDGELDSDEKALILSIGLRRGLKEWQINELLEDTSTHEFFVPDGVANRMNLLYDVMQIVYADGRVTGSEIAFVTNIIKALNLEIEVVEELLDLFRTTTPNHFQWNEFIETVMEPDAKKYVTIL